MTIMLLPVMVGSRLVVSSDVLPWVVFSASVDVVVPVGNAVSIINPCCWSQAGMAGVVIEMAAEAGRGCCGSGSSFGSNRP